MVHLIWMNRNPVCDFMGCQAGRMICEKLEIPSCSYKTRREARAVLRKVNKTDYAGAVHIRDGECPRVAAMDEVIA